MIVTPTRIPDVLVIEPKVYGDERGFFMESFNQRAFEEATGVPVTFVQDNHSLSQKGVLRGLHYQLKFPQGKLVRVTRGEIFDVVVDMREGSPTLGHWVAVTLNQDNKRMLWAPPGFAHGFYVSGAEAEVHYKCTRYYAPEDEVCIHWQDADLAIDWPILESKRVIVSDKDAQGRSLKSSPKTAH